jgi:hypothetical protein
MHHTHIALGILVGPGIQQLAHAVNVTLASGKYQRRRSHLRAFDACDRQTLPHCTQTRRNQQIYIHKNHVSDQSTFADCEQVHVGDKKKHK